MELDQGGNMSNKFSVPATLKSVSTLVDGGLSVGFHTQELTKEEMLAIMSFSQGFGYLLFASTQMSEEDIPKEKLSPDEEKSPSKRLRSILFILWKQQGGEGDFEAFYRKKMEAIIEQLKSRLV